MYVNGMNPNILHIDIPDASYTKIWGPYLAIMCYMVRCHLTEKWLVKTHFVIWQSIKGKQMM